MVIMLLQEEGGHRGLIQYSCYCWLPWPFLYDIKVIVFGGGRQKPFPLLLPSTGLLDVEDNTRHLRFADKTRWICLVEVHVYYQVWLQIPIRKCTQTSLLQWLAVITDGRIRTEIRGYEPGPSKVIQAAPKHCNGVPCAILFLVNA